MKHLKLFFFAVAMTMGTAVMANPSSPNPNTSIPYEMVQMLAKPDLVIEKGFRLRILFSLSEDMRIQVHHINSGNEEVNAFLMERLENRKISGKNWKAGKIYELPVSFEIKK